MLSAVVTASCGHSRKAVIYNMQMSSLGLVLLELYIQIIASQVWPIGHRLLSPG